MALAEIELRRLRAIRDVDVNALQETHAPGFLLCTPSGAVWDRDRYLNDLIQGRLRYLRFDPVTEIESVESDALGVVRYRSVIDLVSDSGANHLECWHLDVYERSPAGLWMCRWSQATDTIPN